MALATREGTAIVSCREHPDVTLLEDHHAGDMICPVCGLVVGDRVVDVGSEWRTFMDADGSSKDHSRVGREENPLFEGSLPSSYTMHSKNSLKDEFGRAMYSSKRGTGNPHALLCHGFGKISQMADRLHLPRTLVDRTNTLFKQIHESKILKGHNVDATVSACLYVACREDNVPRTFKEICAVSQSSVKNIGRSYRIIVNNLKTSIGLANTGDFMSRFCGILGLSSAIQKAAKHIAEKAGELRLVLGRNPVSVAAAAIYMAAQISDNKTTAKEISDIVGVAEATLKQTYKSLYPKASELIPPGCNASELIPPGCYSNSHIDCLPPVQFSFRTTSQEQLHKNN